MGAKIEYFETATILHAAACVFDIIRNYCLLKVVAGAVHRHESLAQKQQENALNTARI